MMAALRHRARAAGALATLLLAGGCMVGPDYHRPAAVLSLRYKELAGWVPARPSDMAAKGEWWRIYNDPRLNILEARVAISNQNVATYAAQYVEAQATVQEARAQLFPTLGATAGVTRSSIGAGTSRSSGFSTGATVAGAATGTTTAVAVAGRKSTTTTQYTVEGTASWDLDLWGKIRRQVQSDVAAAQVSAADLKNAELSAQGSLATDYVELEYEDSLGDVLRATVKA